MAFLGDVSLLFDENKKDNKVDKKPSRGDKSGINEAPPMIDYESNRRGVNQSIVSTGELGVPAENVSEKVKKNNPDFNK